MTSGLVNASFSLPEWQAVKMIFFAPFLLDVSFIEGSIIILHMINLIMILEKALEFLRTDVNFFCSCFLITDQTFG